MNSKRITLGGVILALILAILVIGIKQSAGATGDEPCVPSEAWTETIDHPAVTEVVYHDEISHVEYKYAKFTRTKMQHTEHGAWQYVNDWTPWVPETHVSWQLIDIPALGFPEFHSEWSERHGGHKDYYQRDWQARRVLENGTRTVVDREYYEETIVLEEAWTETIEHPAVVCEEEPTEEPTPTDPPTECPRFLVEGDNGDCVVPPCPEDDPNRTDCTPSEEPTDEPEVDTATRAERKCISQTEVKITTYENLGGVWVDMGATFEPATKKDHCKVDVPTSVENDDTAHLTAVEEVYDTAEEGM